jgi:hypothetical protein
VFACIDNVHHLPKKKEAFVKDGYVLRWFSSLVKTTNSSKQLMLDVDSKNLGRLRNNKNQNCVHRRRHDNPPS